MDGGSQDYEFQTDFMGEGGHARISKKKRKKIFKSSNAGRRLEGVGVQGMAFVVDRIRGLSSLRDIVCGGDTCDSEGMRTIVFVGGEYVDVVTGIEWGLQDSHTNRQVCLHLRWGCSHLS